MVEDKTKLKSYLIYADGTFAIFDSLNEIIIETNGIKETFIEFILRPTTKARIKHNISEKDSSFMNTGQNAGWYRMKYKEKYCRQLDKNPLSSVWLLSCDYQGKFIDLYGGEQRKWIEKNRVMVSQNEALRAENISLSYENRKLATNTMTNLRHYTKQAKGFINDIGAPIVAKQEGGQGGGN